MSEPNSGNATGIGLLVTIALAFIGYAVKYWHDLEVGERKAEIKLLSDQIQFLYGPLYGLCLARPLVAERRSEDRAQMLTATNERCTYIRRHPIEFVTVSDGAIAHVTSIKNKYPKYLVQGSL
jgi:hypothetical protein